MKPWPFLILVALLAQRSTAQDPPNPTMAEVNQARTHIRNAILCFFGAGPEKMGGPARKKQLLDMLGDTPERSNRIKPLSGKGERRHAGAFMVASPDSSNHTNTDNNSSYKKGGSKRGIAFNTRRINRLCGVQAPGKPGLALLASVLAHEAYHDLDQELELKKRKAPPAKKEDGKKDCAKGRYKLEFPAYCLQIQVLCDYYNKQTPPAIPPIEVLKMKNAWLELKLKLLEDYINSQAEGNEFNTKGSVVEEQGLGDYQILFGKSDLYVWNSATQVFDAYDIGMSSLRDIFLDNTTLLAVGNKGVNGDTARIVAFNTTTKTVSQSKDVSSASYGSVYWDTANNLLYIHDDLNHGLIRVTYSGGAFPASLPFWIQSVSDGSGGYTNEDLRSHVKISDFSQLQIVVVPDLNNHSENDTVFKYAQVSGQPVRTPVAQWDFDNMSWRDIQKEGDLTVHVAGPAGNPFQLEEVDSLNIIASGTFASEEFQLVSVPPLDHKLRYWIRDMTDGSKSSILVAQMEDGIPQQLTTGKTPDCVAEEAYINHPEYRVRVGECVNNDTCGLVVGAEGVSTIVINPDGSATIQNPLLTDTTTATHIIPAHPGVGADAEFPLPVPDDPNLAGLQYYFQVAIWDTTALVWKFSEVITMQIWLTDPYIPPGGAAASSGGGGGLTRSQAAAMQKWCVMLMGKYGYKRGLHGLRSPKKK